MKKSFFIDLLIILFFFILFCFSTVLTSPFRFSLASWALHLSLIAYFAFHGENWTFPVLLLITAFSYSLFSIAPWGTSVLVGLVLRVFVKYSKDMLNHKFFFFPSLLVVVLGNIWLLFDFIAKLVKGNMYYSNDYLDYLLSCLIIGLFTPVIFIGLNRLKDKLDA